VWGPMANSEKGGIAAAFNLYGYADVGLKTYKYVKVSSRPSLLAVIYSADCIVASFRYDHEMEIIQ
jgi:hypothetical protein